MFSGVTNRASLSGSLMDEAGFGRCQENYGVKLWGVFFQGLGHLVPVKGNVNVSVNATTYSDI